jgi:hypothetical protein
VRKAAAHWSCPSHGNSSRGAAGSGSGSGSSAIADCVRAPIHASLEQFRTSEYK